jgi:glycosyltransferase involved in cell wall biosynthesis
MELAAFEISRRLLDRGWDLTVISRSCALPPGPRLRFVRLRSPARPVSIALAVSAVGGTAAVRRHRRGLLWVHNSVLANRTDVLTLQFCERAYRALVGVPRNSRPTLAYRAAAELASLIDLTLETWLIRRRARTVACVSGGLASEVARFYPDGRARRTVIFNGVDRERFAPDPELGASTRRELGLPEDAAVAVFVGGDWQRKNLAVAIDGVARAPSWRLIVVGHGDQERFAALADELGAAGRVHFVGRTDPRPYYAAADALLATTGYEAFSLVTLEGAASGLALVVSPVNGSDELVEEGVNGHVVTPEAGLVGERLEQLAGDRAALRAMGQAARATSAAFDWERITDAYEALFAELGASA